MTSGQWGRFAPSSPLPAETGVAYLYKRSSRRLTHLILIAEANQSEPYARQRTQYSFPLLERTEVTLVTEYVFNVTLFFRNRKMLILCSIIGAHCSVKKGSYILIGLGLHIACFFLFMFNIFLWKPWNLSDLRKYNDMTQTTRFAAQTSTNDVIVYA